MGFCLFYLLVVVVLAFSIEGSARSGDIRFLRELVKEGKSRSIKGLSWSVLYWKVSRFFGNSKISYSGDLFLE